MKRIITTTILASVISQVSLGTNSKKSDQWKTLGESRQWGVIENNTLVPLSDAGGPQSGMNV